MKLFIILTTIAAVNMTYQIKKAIKQHDAQNKMPVIKTIKPKSK
jgi:hypothetical protein